LPANARLTIDGQSTKSTSANRLFITPPLQGGSNYQYLLRAEITRDGQRLTQQQKVTVRPGEETSVTFNFATAEVSENP
jgi:uncharacterized protein (TIGR03000 family)